MAKRSSAGNLAGLAGLAALGYMALKGKGESAPVEDRTAKPAGEYDPIASGDWSYGEQGMMAKEPGGGSSVAPPKAEPLNRSMRSAKADVQDDSGTPDRRGLSEAASMARNYKPRRDDPGTLDLRGTSEAQRMDKYYRPRRGRAPSAQESDLGTSYGASMVKPRTSGYETPYDRMNRQNREAGIQFKKGGAVKVKKMASGGMTTSSASKRADGIATKGKTRGKMY